MSDTTRTLFGGDSDEADRLVADAVLESSPPKPRVDDDAIYNIIDQLRRTSALPYRERIAVRLERLQEAFKDDGEGAVFSADSLRGMLMFLERTTALPYPSLTLTPDGESCASWEGGGDDYTFNSLFRDAQKVQFFTLYPDADAPGTANELSGSMTVKSLNGLASYVKLADWAT